MVMQIAREMEISLPIVRGDRLLLRDRMRSGGEHPHTKLPLGIGRVIWAVQLSTAGTAAVSTARMASVGAQENEMLHSNVRCLHSSATAASTLVWLRNVEKTGVAVRSHAAHARAWHTHACRGPIPSHGRQDPTHCLCPPRFTNSSPPGSPAAAAEHTSELHPLLVDHIGVMLNNIRDDCWLTYT
jgi:hypothetical protein